MAECNIDGRTSLYALAGQSIGFSPVPSFFNNTTGFVGYNAVMLPFHTEKYRIQVVLDALRVLNCQGVYIDAPHRCELDNLLVSMTEEAQSCGAVNVIRMEDRGFYGHNTEIDAFRKAFPIITGEELYGKRIFIIGSGGIARAIAVACAQSQCESMTIANRTPEKSQQLCDLINSRFDNLAIVADFSDSSTIHSFYNAEIIIHATSAGMFPQMNTYSFPENYRFMSHHLVLDTVYNPPQTRLLQMAEEKGCRVFNGRDIMFFSCMEAFQWWTGVKIDDDTENKLFNIWREMIYNI